MQKSSNRGEEGEAHTSSSIVWTSRFEKKIECMICSEDAWAIFCFPCGHYVCYICGLRIRRLKQNCPVCRKPSEGGILTTRVSVIEDQYCDEEVKMMKHGAILDSRLSCFIDSEELAREMGKLYLPLCPLPQCWANGHQEPFANQKDLRQHMLDEHKLMYCRVCLERRPLFLSEQTLYSESMLQSHNQGTCELDSAAFTGHPRCLFCMGRQMFLDGEDLVKHMVAKHFSCDLCNREQFTFAFFPTHEKLCDHFHRSHKICEHPKCTQLNIMERVYRDEFDLDLHRQREHNARPATFRPGNFDLPAVGRHANHGASTSSTPAPTAGVANAADITVMRITFDFVEHQKVLELTPKPQKGVRHEQRRRGGGHSHSRDTTARQAYHAPACAGLPPHFVTAESVVHPMRRETSAEEAAELAKEAAASAGASDQEVLLHTKWGDNSSAIRASASHHRQQQQQKGYNVSQPEHEQEQQKQQEFGEDVHRGGGGGRQRRRANPAMEEEQRRRAATENLDALLQRELPSTREYDLFKNETRHFMNNVVKTTEFFDTLTSLFSADALESVVLALAATCPPDQEEKRIALREMWRMRTAPEVVRQERARREEVEAAAGKHQRQRQDHAKQPKGQRQNNNVTFAAALTGSPTSPNERFQEPGGTFAEERRRIESEIQRASQWNHLSSGVGGGSTTTPPSSAPTPAPVATSASVSSVWQAPVAAPKGKKAKGGAITSSNAWQNAADRLHTTTTTTSTSSQQKAGGATTTPSPKPQSSTAVGSFRESLMAGSASNYNHSNSSVVPSGSTDHPEKSGSVTPARTGWAGVVASSGSSGGHTSATRHNVTNNNTTTTLIPGAEGNVWGAGRGANNNTNNNNNNSRHVDVHSEVLFPSLLSEEEQIQRLRMEEKAKHMKKKTSKKPQLNAWFSQ